MPKRILLFIFLLILSVVPFVTTAQSENDVVNRADSVIKQYNPDLGLPRSWTYTFSTSTNDGSLGCPLVASYDLGYYVQPWRVEISYETAGPYVVYLGYRNPTTPDITVPCDTKLGVAASTQPNTGTGGPTQPPEIQVVQTCSATALGASAGVYEQPNAQGAFLVDLANLTYLSVVGRTVDTGHYEVSLGNRNGWVSFYDVVLAGPACGNIPVTSSTVSTTAPSLTGTGGTQFDCVATGVLANVRGAPSLSGPIVDRLETGEVFGVTGRTPGTGADVWYLVNASTGQGWVSSTVSSIQGAGCAALQEVGGTTTTNASGQSFTVTSAPVNTNCPAGFTGFLAPQLQAGQPAVVTFDGLRVRTQPNPQDNSNIIFEMPNGTVFNVQAGPVCEGTRVWWQVNLNGVFGWTAESDTVAGYYAEPRVQSVGVRFADPLLDVNAEIGRVETGGTVASIAFTADGADVAVANAADGFIRTWDTATGEDVNVNFLHSPGYQMAFVAYEPSGTRALTADITNLVEVWNGEQLVNTINAGTIPFLPGDVAVSPDWSTVAVSGCFEGDIVAGCDVGGVSVFDLETGDLIRTLETDATSHIAYSADSARIVAAGNAGAAVVFDLGTDETITLSLDAARIRQVAFAPGGEQIAAIVKASDDAPQELVLWSIIDDAQAGSIFPDADATTFAYSPDGTLLALGNADNKVILWDVVGNKQLEAFEGYVNGILSLAFSADSATLASGDNAGNLVLLDVGLE